jgi:dTDP-glucose 4,6-dehydratase
MNLKSKRIFITGGAGFIGSNFVRYIHNKYPNYKLIVLDLLTYAGNLDNFSSELRNDPNFSFWYGDVINADLVSDLVSQSDIVVHFAAESHVTRSIFDNKIFFATDVLGTQAVANAVLKYNNSVERFIHISSSEVYGTAVNEPMTEDHRLNPMSPYASAKVGADRLVYSYWATYNIPAIILRPFNNYGPSQHLEKAIPRFITSCILNEPITIHGDGRSERDWIFVDNVCEAIDAAMHCDLGQVKGEAINVGTGRAIDILTIATMVAEKMGKPESIITHVGDRPGQVMRHISSTTKAKNLLNWEAVTNFEEGLTKTIKWYENNRQWWERLLWMRRVPIISKNGKLEYH